MGNRTAPFGRFGRKEIVRLTIPMIGVVALALASPGPLSPSPAAAQLPGELRVSAGGPYFGVVGQPVHFHAEIDLGGVHEAMVEVTWDFGDGSTGTGQSVDHTYTASATYNVTVTVTDQTRVANDFTTAQISPSTMPLPGQLTVNAGGPYFGHVGVPVYFSAQVGLGGRPPGTPVQIQWQFGDGTVGQGATTSHTYATPGTYNVVVTAEVGPGQMATDSTTVTISGQVPPPVLNVNPAGPYTGTVGRPITFTGSASPIPPGATAVYTWTFGDGRSATGPVVAHTYTAAGTYTVTLTVTTTAGQSGSANTSATATVAPPPPPATTPVPLTTGCSNVALTWPPGTPVSTVAAAVTPSGALISIWRLNPATQAFLGFSPTAPAIANDYNTVSTSLEAVFICMQSPGTLNRPATS